MDGQEFEILTHNVNRDVYRMKNIKKQLKQKVDEIADDYQIPIHSLSSTI